MVSYNMKFDRHRYILRNATMKFASHRGLHILFVILLFLSYRRFIRSVQADESASHNNLPPIDLLRQEEFHHELNTRSIHDPEPKTDSHLRPPLWPELPLHKTNRHESQIDDHTTSQTYGSQTQSTNQFISLIFKSSSSPQYGTPLNHSNYRPFNMERVNQSPINIPPEKIKEIDMPPLNTQLDDQAKLTGQTSDKPADEDEEKQTSTTISVDLRVKKEVDVYMPLLIRLISNDEARLMFTTLLETWIQRALLSELENKKLIAEKALLKNEKENIKAKALKTFVIPYLCRNFELYENAWDNGGVNSDNFDATNSENTEVKVHDLDTNTLQNYEKHAKIWDRILTSSKNPSAIEFKTKLSKCYPLSEVPLNIHAKNIALSIALLNNAKHGAANDEPDIVALINPNDLIKALMKWNALKSPVLLNIIKIFEEVVSGVKSNEN